jgi:hypothetical protein
MPTAKLVVDTLRGMADLGLIGAPKVSETVIELYLSALDGVDDATFTAAAGEHLRTNKFYPKPAELVEIAERMQARAADEVYTANQFALKAERDNPSLRLMLTDPAGWRAWRVEREAYWKEHEHAHIFAGD